MALYQHGLIAAFGTFLIVIGIVIPRLIDWQVRDALRAALSVTGTDDSGYESWRKGSAQIGSRNILAYELTNPVAFAGGAPPNVAEWSASDEVVLRYTRTQSLANWSSDLTQVNYLSTVSYAAQPDHGSLQKYLLTVNYAYVTLVAATGGETNLWITVANGMLGTMISLHATLWLTSNSFCIMGGICGLARYASVTSNPVPSFSPTQLAQLGALLPNPTWLGTYLQLVPAINNPATPAGTRSALIAQANLAFPFFDFTPTAYGGSSDDGLNFLSYLSDLVSKTSTTVTAAYQTTPYGLFIKNTTLYNHIFAVDPLMALLNQQASILANNSVANNTVHTGYGDDYFLGMDYFEQVGGRVNVTSYPGGSFSLAGRQTSTAPFQPTMPASIPLYFQSAQRFVTANYSADVTVKSIPASRYLVDGEALTQVNAAFGTKVAGLLDFSYTTGAQLWASQPRQFQVDSVWTAKTTGMPAADPTASKSFIDIERLSGAGIQGQAKLLFHCYINMTKTPITGFSSANGALAIPLFQIVDVRLIADDTANSLYAAAVKAPKVERIILVVLVVAGAVLFGIAAVSYVVWLLRGRDETEVPLEMRDKPGASGEDTEMGISEAVPRGAGVSNPFDGAVVPMPTAGEDA